MGASFPFARKPAGHHSVIVALKDLVAERFRLSEEDTIMVAELTCAVPGCPPLETVFAFWPADAARRHFKIFKPASDIVADDLPPWWMKDALIQPDGADCSCC